MRAKKLRGTILLVTLAVITLPTVRGGILCFCNSPSCLQAVCESSRRCFTRLVRKASADGIVSTSIMYGCSEALNSSGICVESSVTMCCNKELCNMPNMLRKVTYVYQRKSPVATTNAPKVYKKVPCNCSSSPAMRVASVAAPSVLILTVILLSLAMCRKMTDYQKKQKKSDEKLINRSSHLILTRSSVDSDIPQSFSAESISTSELVTNPYSV